MKKARKPSKKLARRLSARTGNAAIPRKVKRKPVKTRAEHLNEESKSAESQNDLFPIVGVGASAGLEAFTVVFQQELKNPDRRYMSLGT